MFPTLLTHKFAKYNKCLTVVLAVILTGLNQLYGSNADVQLLIMAAAALGVYVVPNGKV